MIFGKEGQFVASINIDGINEDFMEHDDLYELTIIEEAGNVLPTFQIAFKTYLEELAVNFTDGTFIRVGMGSTIQDMEEYTLVVTSFSSVPVGNAHVEIEAVGFASKINYITDQPQQITDKQSGIEAAITAASNHFDVDTNVQKSRDSQNWIQYSITDKKFIDDTLAHVNIPNSFVATAITAGGKFILRDVAKYIKSLSGGFDWKFTKENDGNDNKTIIIEGDLQISSQQGIINNWTGYKRVANGISIKQKMITDISSDNQQPLLSLASEVSKAKSIKDRFSGTRLDSGNIHSEYWTCKEKNLKGLADMSRISIPVSFSNEFKKVEPLQVAMYVQQSVQSEEQASELVTGLYIISKVAKTIQANTFNITTILNKEALNKVRNDA